MYSIYMKTKYNSIDLFSGCGGLSVGLHRAGFVVNAALEINSDAVQAYKLNHKKTYLIEEDIRKVEISEIQKLLNGQPLHLLAGCPPCQGFSSVRRLNRGNVRDGRNNLIFEYLRFVKELRPLTIMMENVPGLIKYYRFNEMMEEFKKLGYKVDVDVVNVKDYGVPQRRRRLVLVGSLLGEIKIAKGNGKKVTVRETIGKLESVSKTKDPVHKIYATHRDDIMEMIRLIPKNGGSRKDLPIQYILECHKKENVGFNDIYGRLRWDDYSTTITGGCLNPSKGRFLHPDKHRVITAREAALLQSFPKSYKFPMGISKTALALLIGNALPPKFSYIQSKNIKNHIDAHLG